MYTIKNIFGGSAGTLQVQMKQMPFKVFPNFKPPSQSPPSQGPPSQVPPQIPPSQVPPAVVLPQPTYGLLPYTSTNRDGTIQMYEVLVPLGTNLKLYFTYTDPYTVALYQENRGSL